MDAGPGSTTAVNVRTLIDTQPISAYQWMVTAMCGLIVFVDGFDAQAMGFVAPALTADLHVSRAVLGSVLSSGLIGMMIGALLFGPVADRIGRKPVLIASTLIFGVGSLLTATANTVDGLSLYRFLTGLGMGGAMPNAIALTSDTCRRGYRATAVTAMMCGFSLGAAVGGFVAAALIPRFGWESVFVAGGRAAVIARWRWCCCLNRFAFCWAGRGRARAGRVSRANRPYVRITPPSLLTPMRQSPASSWRDCSATDEPRSPC